MEKRLIDERRFWVVSPNVNNNPHNVNEWRQASVLHRAAFMGWHSDDHGHAEIGYDFAHRIEPNDIILIARRHNRIPEVVGFGVVQGDFLLELTNFDPPGDLGSIRKLSPFFPLSRAPLAPQFMAVLSHTKALREMRPGRSPGEKAVCEWLLEKIYAAESLESNSLLESKVKHIQLKHQNELEYEFRTSESIAVAKKLEAELVNSYRLWIENQDRTLEVVSSNGQRCDAFEKDRNNLLEAKCSSKREYIRMAVGQLLEYSFLIREGGPELKLAVLLPEKPDMSKLEWLAAHEISVVWKESNAFLDNANGQFT